MKEKWRGIRTTSEEINEDEAVTVVNRLGQKTISLPRITDDKRWAGFPGLAGTAKKIAKMVPSCLYYVEPFAGTAKVNQELIKRFKDPTDEIFIQEAILNDKSRFIYDWLEKEFPQAVITNFDFTDCIERWNSPNTVFMIDPPWNKSYYLQKFSCFDRKNTNEYYEELLDMCNYIRGKFIITTRKENKMMLNSGYKNILIESIYAVSGKYPKVMVTTNL